MRIALVALGTRGDVQPYIALGQGLKHAGHEVRLLTHENFSELVQSYGLTFYPMRGNVQEIAQREDMRELLAQGNFIAITAKTAKEAKQAAIEWSKDGLAACHGVNVIIAGLGGLFIGYALAQKLEIPFIQTYLMPFTPTQAFPSVLFPKSIPIVGRVFNPISHHLTRQIMWQGSRSGDNLARRDVLDLPKASFWGPFNDKNLQQYPILYGYSEYVIPKPADWSAQQQITGYWFLDEPTNWQPPRELLAFLESGMPPLYIGFGSMTSRDSQHTTTTILHALEKTGQRAVISSGWAGLEPDNLPNSVYMINSIPHSWLFPKTSGVIHHGGAGTTAAGLRAGVPGIVVPFFGDQPFWGNRLAQLGVGTQPIPQKQLTVNRLASAIHTITTDQALQARAAQLGEQIQAEDGVQAAVAILESLTLPDKTLSKV